MSPKEKNCDAGKQYKTPSSIHSCLTHACAGARSMKRSRACSRIPGRVSIQAHDLENWWLRTSRSSPAVLLHTHTHMQRKCQMSGMQHGQVTAFFPMSISLICPHALHDAPSPTLISKPHALSLGYQLHGLASNHWHMKCNHFHVLHMPQNHLAEFESRASLPNRLASSLSRPSFTAWFLALW